MGDGNGDGRFSCGLWLGDRIKNSLLLKKSRPFFQFPLESTVVGMGMW